VRYDFRDRERELFRLLRLRPRALLDRLRLPDERLGTLPPARRASERPIAIACVRLFTFRPDLPDRRVPCLRSCIAFRTFCFAFAPYFAISPPRCARCCALTTSLPLTVG